MTSSLSFTSLSVAAICTLIAIVVFFVKKSYIGKREGLVVITGAAHGIGRRLAYIFAARGPVYLIDTDRRRLLQVASNLRSKSSYSVFMSVTDVASDSAVSAVCRSILSIDQPIAAIVLNAGIVNGRNIEKLSTEELHRLYSVNVFQIHYFIRYLLPKLKEQGSGAIAAISSLMGYMGGARLSDYSGSKFAILGLMESLRLELRRDGFQSIDTIVCSPYLTNTGMFSGAMEGPTNRNIFRDIFFPIMDEKKVAFSIFRSIMKGGHQSVTIPFILGPCGLIARAVLPLFIYDAVLDFFGGVRGMETFIPSKHKRQDSISSFSKS